MAVGETLGACQLRNMFFNANHRTMLTSSTLVSNSVLEARKSNPLCHMFMALLNLQTHLPFIPSTNHTT